MKRVRAANEGVRTATKIGTARRQARGQGTSFVSAKRLGASRPVLLAVALREPCRGEAARLRRLDLRHRLLERRGVAEAGRLLKLGEEAELRAGHGGGL